MRAAVAPDALPADAFGARPVAARLRAHRARRPARDPTPRCRQLLTAAGWTRDDDGRWRDGGEPVQLVIGAAAERPADVKVAENVAAQLEAAGIDTTVVAPTGRRAVRPADRPAHPAEHQRPRAHAPTSATPTPRPRATPGASDLGGDGTTPRPPPRHPTAAPAAGVAVDVVVRPRTVGGDPATELASDYGCDDPVTPNGPPPRPSVPTTCSSALQPLLDELLADPDGSNAGDDARGRREAAVVAGPGAAAVPAGLAAREHPGADAGPASGPDR